VGVGDRDKISDGYVGPRVVTKRNGKRHNMLEYNSDASAVGSFQPGLRPQAVVFIGGREQHTSSKACPRGGLNARVRVWIIRGLLLLLLGWCVGEVC
jgi:hypothetical protein